MNAYFLGTPHTSRIAEKGDPQSYPLDLWIDLDPH
jgi:hypothetical protein